MKHFCKFIFILILFSAVSCSNPFNSGDTSTQPFDLTKKFPQIPELPNKYPSSLQIGHWETFKSEHPGWYVRWGEKTGMPRSIFGPLLPAEQGFPEQIARAFISKNSLMFRMKDGIPDMMLYEIQKRTFTHVVFQQTYSGISVEGSIYAVHLTKDGRIYLANGDYFDDVSVPSVRSTISGSEAVLIASGDLGQSLDLRSSPETNLAILPYGSEYRLIWKVMLTAAGPLGRWVYYISAQNGTVLGGYNAFDFEGNTGGAAIADSYFLSQNYPNPFNPVTSISYQLPEASAVTLTVFNVAGQEVALLVDGQVNAGYHTVQWDASDMASGIYFYRIRAGNFTDMKRMIVIK